MVIDLRLERPLSEAELQALADLLGAGYHRFGHRVFIHRGSERLTAVLGEARLSCAVSDPGPVVSYLEQLT
jgi:hypothetical protein